MSLRLRGQRCAQRDVGVPAVHGAWAGAIDQARLSPPRRPSARGRPHAALPSGVPRHRPSGRHPHRKAADSARPRLLPSHREPRQPTGCDDRCASDGILKAAFTVALGPGRYTVAASQTLASGAKTEAASSVFVPIIKGTSSGQFPRGTPVPGENAAPPASTAPSLPSTTSPTQRASALDYGSDGRPMTC
jgi:hypothetical protein